MNPKESVGAEIISDHEFLYHNAHCFQIRVPEKLGSAQAIYYDVAALKESIRIIKKQEIEHPIVYIMACRIGPFIKHFYKKIHKLGGKVYLNPDGGAVIIGTFFGVENLISMWEVGIMQETRRKKMWSQGKLQTN